MLFIRSWKFQSYYFFGIVKAKVKITLGDIFFSFPVAMDNAKLWIIDRSVFQMIMMRTGMMRQAEHIAFLKR